MRWRGGEEGADSERSRQQEELEKRSVSQDESSVIAPRLLIEASLGPTPQGLLSKTKPRLRTPPPWRHRETESHTRLTIDTPGSVGQSPPGQ